MPPFPGAAITSLMSELARHALTKVCSRAPDPITSVFIQIDILEEFTKKVKSLLGRWVKSMFYMGMHFYFMGICGTAMGNVALLLKKMGHEVQGADVSVYPPMSDVLREGGIDIFSGYDVVRLKELNPDMIVVGNVISRGNEEIEWLLESRAIAYCSLSELLKNEILGYRKNIVVAGTHGKTTATTLVAYILDKAGVDPGYLIGGVPQCLPSGAHLGATSAPFVIEGDEYDTAFFDKRSKFIHYLPNIFILNNLEFDHADIFRDLTDIKRAFSHVLRLVPRNGFVLVNGDDENIKGLMPLSWTNVLTVGVESGNDLRIIDFEDTVAGSSFSLIWKDELWGRVNWSISGLYNARNAAMALLASGLALNKKCPQQLSVDLVKGYNGVKRRQEVLLNKNGKAIVEDFAHHPTAVRETLNALKGRYPGYYMTACFEPRSNTTCRSFHQQTLPEALSVADEVFLGPLYKSDVILKEDRFNLERAVEDLTGKGVEANAVHSFDSLIDSLRLSSENRNMQRQKHLICFLTNGSYGGVISKMVSNFDCELSESSY